MLGFVIDIKVNKTPTTLESGRKIEIFLKDYHMSGFTYV